MEAFQFDWDEENIRHLQVVVNRPVDLGTELRNDEERTAQVGETDAGRILIGVTTMQNRKIRVITAWPAKERFRRYFQTQKRNGNVGRVEKQDLQE